MSHTNITDVSKNRLTHQIQNMLLRSIKENTFIPEYLRWEEIQWELYDEFRREVAECVVCPVGTLSEERKKRERKSLFAYFLKQNKKNLVK